MSRTGRLHCCAWGWLEIPAQREWRRLGWNSVYKASSALPCSSREREGPQGAPQPLAGASFVMVCKVGLGGRLCFAGHWNVLNFSSLLRRNTQGLCRALWFLWKGHAIQGCPWLYIHHVQGGLCQGNCPWRHSIPGNVLCGCLGNSLCSSGFKIQQRSLLTEWQPHPTVCLENSPPTPEGWVIINTRLWQGCFWPRLRFFSWVTNRSQHYVLLQLWNL